MKICKRIVPLLMVAFILLTGMESCKKEQPRGPLKTIWYDGSYNRDFNDQNDVQLPEAQRIGIQPIASQAEAEEATKDLVQIASNEFYDVDDLTHSIPFLIPQAADLLEQIGRNFQDTLRNRNASLYRILVTSVTRTTEDVGKLNSRNRNSVLNSSHLYGTTFDVSWNRFNKVDPQDTIDIDKDHLKMVLAMVLRDLRSDSLCYVKHERHQGCFHITVRNK